MEVSIHAEYLQAQYLSTQLGGVYGGGGTSFPPAIDKARTTLPPVPDSGEATVVSLSYRSLDLQISMDASELRELEESEETKPALDEKFSPEAVSGRIIDFVKGLFETFRGQGPDGDVNFFATEVARGVEEGFAEAREILKSMDMLTDSIANIIGETHRLTVDKLGDFFGSIGVTLENLLRSTTELTGQAPAQAQAAKAA